MLLLYMIFLYAVALLSSITPFSRRSILTSWYSFKLFCILVAKEHISHLHLFLYLSENICLHLAVTMHLIWCQLLFVSLCFYMHMESLMKTFIENHYVTFVWNNPSVILENDFFGWFISIFYKKYIGHIRIKCYVLMINNPIIKFSFDAFWYL